MPGSLSWERGVCSYGCPRLDFLAVNILFSAWSSGEGVGIVVLPALAALDLAGRLPLEVLEAHEVCERGVDGAQLEL
jgi:hypothetical protein